MKKQIDKDYVELLFKDIHVEFDMVTTFKDVLPHVVVHSRSKDINGAFRRRIIVHNPDIPLHEGINEFKRI